MKQRWVEYQNRMRAGQASAKSQPVEQTKTGATTEEVKTEEVKEETKTAMPAKTKTENPDTITKAPMPMQPASASTEPTIAERMDAMTAANPHAPRTDVDKSISTYNGGTTSKYKWSQQIFNVDV